MILMYCYSTYKFSPVGFAIGCVLLPIESNSTYTELKKCRDDFVKKCFENDIIRNVYGQNPKTKHYCLMVKGLRSEFVNEDNMPSHKKGNFLFEFDNSEEYKRFIKNYDKSKLESAMNEFIVPDSFAETFALKMDTKKLNDYISSVLSEKADSKTSVECNKLYFDTSSSDSSVAKEISQILGCPVYKVGQNKFSTMANFQKPTLWEVLRVLAIIVAILGGIALIAGLGMWIINLNRP